MYIEKRKNGYKFSEKYRGRDGKWHTKSITLDKNNAKSRVEARHILDQKIEESLFIAERIRLSRLVEIYCNRSSATERTLVNYKFTFKKIIELLGDPIISDIRISFLINHLEEVRDNVSTYNRYVTLLKIVFNWAYKRDYINVDLARKLEFLKDKSTKDISDKYLEPDQLHSVLEAMAERYPYDYYVCKFMALTGMRIGEVIALKMDDFIGDYIRVDETYDEHRGTFDDPKGAVRNVYIQEELKSFLKTLMIVRKERMLQYGIRNIDLVFFSKLGNPYSYSPILKKVKEVSSESIHKKITPHAFRHTHVSLLAAEGMSLDAISRRIGHADTKITKDIYFHVTKKMQERDNAEIRNIKIG